MPLLCYDCNRQTKRKYEDKNKTNTFFMYVQQVYLMKNKKNKETKSILYYGCMI